MKKKKELFTDFYLFLCSFKVISVNWDNNFWYIQLFWGFNIFPGLFCLEKFDFWEWNGWMIRRRIPVLHWDVKGCYRLFIILG